MWKTVKTDEYTLRILEGAGWNEFDDNIDIEVILNSGERYGASLFTLQNLKTLMDRYKETGENSSGEYIWSPDMIVLRQLTVEAILKVVNDVISSGRLNRAFTRLEILDDGTDATSSSQ